jgi:hypothetical protein
MAAVFPVKARTARADRAAAAGITGRALILIFTVLV